MARSTSGGGRRAELVALAGIGLPLAGANLAELGMQMTDMAVVGRLGAVELAAVGLSGQVVFDAMAILMGVLTVVGVLAAEAYGTGDEDRVAAIAGQGLRVALVLSLPLIALALALPAILSLTDQDPAVLALGTEYLHAVLWSFPTAMAYAVLVDVAAALHRPRVVFAVSIGALAANALLSWGLVFGVAGLPALGVAGAGYATSLVNAGMVLCLAAACRLSPALRPWFAPGAMIRGDAAAGRDIVKVGLPVAGMTVAESGMFTVVMVLIGGFGAVVLAASKIVFGFVSLSGALAFALADAAAIRIALAAGRGDGHQVRRAGALAMLLGVALMAVFAAAALTLPGAIAALFLGNLDAADAEVVRWTAALFGIGALYLVLSGLQTIAEHALRGLRDTLVPMWQSLAGLWLVGLAGGCALAYGADLGVEGLWLGMAAGSAVTATAFVRRFLRLSSRLTSDSPR